MKNKRAVASLLPYRKIVDSFEFFLQKRDTVAPTNPDVFGLFGGGIEAGETIEQGLIRELQEELEYVPKNPVYFSRYENATHVNHVFIEEVDLGFESTVIVHEGEYGKFMTLDQIPTSEAISIVTLLTVRQVYTWLASQ